MIKLILKCELNAGMDADLGGTSLYATLVDVYNTVQTPGYLTQIFVLTDGHATVSTCEKNFVSIAYRVLNTA